MSKEALMPVEQKTVVFYDDQVVAVRLEDGRIMVPVRPLCKALGIDYAAQRQRVLRDVVLS
ncbi:MAG: hypothetical protein GY943_10545, partial [Chloroflexi bacterium]|nr:hypothetical protein [Chloroflexota bacterium]